MISQTFDLRLWLRIRIVLVLLFLLVVQSLGLNIDGVLLMTFKYNVVSDPLKVLDSWNAGDEIPCSWKGVVCQPVANFSGESLRVTGLVLPDSQLLGSVPSSFGMIQHLRNLDLSNNSINGSIPFTLFNASELQSLKFSNNRMSGELPEVIGRLESLRYLNLSGNAFAGVVPGSLTRLRNLTVVCLKDNYFSGEIPGEFDSVEVFDLSSNLINGSLPPNFGGNRLRYFNVSFNRLSGGIPPEFPAMFPQNATLDLSFNNLTGEIPESTLFLKQGKKAFSGNPNLCGIPLKNLCPIPSTISTPPNATDPTSPPAIAAIPKTIDSKTAGTESPGGAKSGLKTGTIIGIVAGDMAAIIALALIFVYVYRAKRKRRIEETIKKEAESAKDFDWGSGSSSEEYNWLRSWTCLKKQRHAEGDETSESTNSESEDSSEPRPQRAAAEKAVGELVTVDGGEKELELETLLKASAYILGASGSSIMYKAVLEDGTVLAVRRIGEGGVERFREFDNQLRVIGKLAHPNLVRVRGFYWGADEKLVIYDFVPNGSLANACYRKVGSSHRNLPWDVRLKIAKGVARGLAYIHDKKHVHGNLKPSNILLDSDMEPKVGDFGLERLVVGESSRKTAAYGSSRHFGSKRSTASRDSEFRDSVSGGGPTPSPSPSPSTLGISPYLAPESLRSLKPNPKWDVFSFGVVLLELLTGKVVASDEMCPGSIMSVDEDKSKIVRMADVAIRADMEGKEDALLALLKLGYSCISPVSQKRPSMKEIVHALDKFPTPSYY